MLILTKITNSEYISWSKITKETYKVEIMKNGYTEVEAQTKTDDDFKRLLPDGLSTLDHFIFSIKLNEVLIGTLWFAIRGATNNRKAFIYDIFIDDKFRGQGYGKKTMELLEIEVQKMGLNHIGLHVFGHNHVARSLYQKMGYEITNLNLEKVLNKN